MQLSKHQALGNDFLVLVDRQRDRSDLADVARAACDRRTGIGADGLLTLSDGVDGADVTMSLHNADGGRAEMSGNGISCLVQAAVVGGLAAGPEVTVSTDAGLRTVRIEPTEAPHGHLVTVDMGEVTAGDEAADWLRPGVEAARFADAGNPHLVLHVPDPSSGPDLDALGVEANATVAGGVNVELITATDTGIRLDVYERGVGRTQACGTGASAAAVVAAAWGLVDAEVAVDMPGGTAQLTVGERVEMTVPVTAVARVEYLGA
ncbi:MAG: diaminopimelate epimerase [Actinomycetota bacterium]